MRHIVAGATQQQYDSYDTRGGISHDILLIVLATELMTITFGKKEIQKAASIRSTPSLSNSADDYPPQHTYIPLTNHLNTKIQLSIEIQKSVLDMVFYLSMITFINPPLLLPPSSTTKQHTIITNNVD